MSPSESVGDAKTVRACDCCLRCRARWYCAAADAFLCHPCDTSVHAANPLTRRHEHVRLRTASSGIDDVDNDGPTWHHRCKRKARSPRGPHRVSQSKDKDADEKGRGVAAAVAAGPPETMVPDIMEQPAPVEEEEQLLYRVPTLKPMLSEFYSPPPSSSEDNEKPPILPRSTHQTPVDGPTVDLLLPSGIDLAGFDVDVESLFGEGLAEDAFSLEYFLSPVESHKDSGGCEGSFVPVKQEEGVDDDEGSSAVNSRFEAETIGVRFNCGTEEEEKPKRTVARDCGDAKRRRRSIMLSLNYEAVISAWSTQGCPWADGTRPQLNPDDCWPDYTGSILGAKIEGGRGEANIEVYQSGHALVPNGGREARVSRYREKRRTRLFSKKIRYEVRKLNAEKRPRMKGRFVKRSSFMATTTSPSRSRNSSSNSRS